MGCWHRTSSPRTIWKSKSWGVPDVLARAGALVGFYVGATSFLGNKLVLDVVLSFVAHPVVSSSRLLSHMRTS